METTAGITETLSGFDRWLSRLDGEKPKKHSVLEKIFVVFFFLILGPPVFVAGLGAMLCMFVLLPSIVGLFCGACGAVLLPGGTPLFVACPVMANCFLLGYYYCVRILLLMCPDKDDRTPEWV